MLNLSEEGLLFLVRNYYDVFIVAVFSIGVTFLVSKLAWRSLDMTTTSYRGGGIPGRLGLPFVGETLSLLSATSSIKGCYEFVRLRRIRYGKWFKTRIFGQIHVFVPSTKGARAIFSDDFAKFNKGYVKSMADCVGEKSLLCVQHEDHKRIRRLLSEPFSINSLSTFVQKFDKVLCQELKKLEGGGKSFVVLDFSMKITFDAMCSMLLSVTDDSLLRKIDKDCTAVSDAMLAFPYMIPGTRYYKGIKARRRLMETFKDIIGRRRSGKESAEDFLQSMLERDSYPPNEKLQDSEIMDNLLTLIIAGQTTTSAAMMWSVKFLDENREAQERLREEQLSIARARPDGTSATLEDFKNMPYCLKVVKETLRISNVLQWFPRVALSDCTIEGNYIELKNLLKTKKYSICLFKPSLSPSCCTMHMSSTVI